MTPIKKPNADQNDDPPWLKEFAIATSLVVIPTHSAPKAQQISRAMVTPLRPEGLAASTVKVSRPSQTARESTTTIVPNLAPLRKIVPVSSLKPETGSSLPPNGSNAVNRSTGASFGFSDLPHPWDCIAMRESSDHVVDLNTESGDQGAFQFAISTWLEYRPVGYPDTPNQATLWQQYQVALKLHAADGYLPWVTHGLCGV